MNRIKLVTQVFPTVANGLRPVFHREMVLCLPTDVMHQVGSEFQRCLLFCQNTVPAAA